MPEVIPSQTIETLLSAQWNAANVATPTFLDVNDGTPIRHDLHRSDVIIIRTDTPGL